MPPESHTEHKSSDHPAVWWCVGVIAILSLAFAGYGFYQESERYPFGEFKRSSSNSYSIWLHLIEFEKKHGTFPSADTIPIVRESTGTQLKLGTETSNDYFRQIFAENLGDEGFYWSHAPGMKKGDRRVDGDHALEKGECGFAYIPLKSPVG